MIFWYIEMFTGWERANLYDYHIKKQNEYNNNFVNLFCQSV